MCSECSAVFEPTGTGYNDINLHVRNEHDSLPSILVKGVVDLDTGQLLVKGWSPKVLTEARAKGFVQQKDGSWNTERPIDAAKAIVGEGVPAVGGKAKGKIVPLGNSKVNARMGLQRGFVLANNINITPGIYAMFLEFRLRYAKYQGDESDAMSRFLLDAVLCYSVGTRTQTAQLIMQAVQASLEDGRATQPAEGG